MKRKGDGKMSGGNLAEKYEMIRGRMNKTGQQLGLGHPKVLKLSQQLDKIHIILEKRKKGE